MSKSRANFEQVMLKLTASWFKVTKVKKSFSWNVVIVFHISFSRHLEWWKGFQSCLLLLSWFPIIVRILKVMIGSFVACYCHSRIDLIKSSIRGFCVVTSWKVKVFLKWQFVFQFFKFWRACICCCYCFKKRFCVCVNSKQSVRFEWNLLE